MTPAEVSSSGGHHGEIERLGLELDLQFCTPGAVHMPNPSESSDGYKRTPNDHGATRLTQAVGDEISQEATHD
jgi:hypothetical protein